MRNKVHILPTAEHQVRPLTKLEKRKDRTNVWREVVESSYGRPITAKFIEQVVSKKELVKFGQAIINSSLKTVLGDRFLTCR